MFGVSSANLGLDAIDVEDPDSFPIGRVDRAMELLSESQSSVGAAMSRLESALDVEAGVMASMSEGEARVRDAELAVEAAAFAKARLRDQVTTSLLARADVQSDVVLSLLEGL